MAVTQVRAGMLYAWRGPSLLIVGDDGRAGGDDALHGFYYREARFLSRLQLTVNGARPWLCECAAVRPDLLTFSYVHPEISAPGGGGTGQADDGEHLGPGGVPERALDIQVTYQPGVAGLRIETTIANWSKRHVDAELRWALDADFQDLLETQSGRREQEAAVEREVRESSLQLAYAHPQLPYRSEVRAIAGWTPTEEGLSARVPLDPRARHRLVFEVRAHVPGEAMGDEDSLAREAAQDRWYQAFTRVAVPGNRVAEDVIDRNVRDVASFPALHGQADEWLALQAGMPLYPAFFGRDAVTAGWQAALLDRGAALDAAMTRLGRMQATRDDPAHDAESGRLPYQMRSGPLARLGRNPYSAYYADFASPLMYVIALANLYAWTGDVARVRAHWDTARRIMEWARERGDRDGDGYLEYLTLAPNGTKNQGWKDSGDAIIYEDGSPVPAPIATCELQGYWYAAQELMAVLSGVVGARGDAGAYLGSAAALKRRFNRDWWVEADQCLALALDPGKQQVRAVTSNVGHCLATGIIDRDHVRPVVGRLFAPDMFSGWGIRTLSSAHAYYDPLSYHRGTVWAVEQGTIVFGLRRYGFNARAFDLSRAMFDLAGLYPEFRIPECVGGYARDERATPGAYPRANTPQLWNATAFPLIVQSLLGILPVAPLGTLLVDPVLPEWLPQVVLHDLRVGEARVTLTFTRRSGGRTDWDVVRQEGRLTIVRQPPPESISAGVIDRVHALAESAVRSVR